MKPTRHRLRLAIGLLTCTVGVALLCFPKAMLFQRFLACSAWLFIGASLCFVPEFHLKFSRDWFPLALGLLFAGAGLLFTAVAAHELIGPRSPGFLRFYEFAGVGPLLLFTGVLFGFDKNRAI